MVTMIGLVSEKSRKVGSRRGCRAGSKISTYMYIQYLCVYAGHEMGQCRKTCCIFKKSRQREIVTTVM